MESTTVYARVSVEAKAWLDQQSAESGVSIAKIIDLILLDAARRGLRIEMTMPVLVVRPDDALPVHPRPAE